MMRPARAKPTRSLRWSMEVEPSCGLYDELHRLSEQLVAVVVRCRGRVGDVEATVGCR